MGKRFSILVLILLATACIDPYKANGPTQLMMVFDGMITDQPGPYTMKVFWTLPYKEFRQRTRNVNGANLTISDDAGTVEELEETSGGVYATKNIQGVVGRSYAMKVVTRDGYIYQSSFEKLLPVGEITDLRYDFELNEPYIPPQEPDLHTESIGESESPNGFNIKISSAVVPEQEGRVRYRITSTFELFTHPEKIRREPVNCALCPPYCARGLTCTCCHCWVTKHEEYPLLQQVSASEDEITDLPVAFVPANQRLFYNRYWLQVEQLSITENVYRFWTRIQKQKQAGTDLFQTALPPTGGNFEAITGGSPRMIGVFGASSVRKRVLELYESDIPYPMKTDVIVRVCNSLYLGYNSPEKPWYY